MILIEANVPSTFISFEAQRRTQARPLALYRDGGIPDSDRM
jgi:hypothetical protein